MTYMGRMRQARQQALQVDTNANKPSVRIGAVINGNNVVQGSQGPAWVWVSYFKGIERGTPQQVLNRTISPVWDCPVTLGINSQGQPYIIDVDEGLIDAFLSGSSGGSLQSLRTGPHSHEFGAGNYDVVHDIRLVEGKIWWRGSDGPVTVYMNSYWYFDGSGVHQYYAGGTLDLSSILTVTSGQHQWIKLGFDPVAGTPVAVAGTPVSVIVPFQPADLAAISFTGYIPICGVQITYGQAIAGEQDFTDCSQARNGPAGTGGGVTGPGTSTDRAIATWNGTTGSALRNNSNDTIDSSGNVTLGGRLTTQSGRNVHVRVITASGAVTVTNADDVIVVNKTSGAATTVNLPASPATGDTYCIKDGKGDAATNNITITPNAGNIDGASTYVININYGGVFIVYNGTQWNISTFFTGSGGSLTVKDGSTTVTSVTTIKFIGATVSNAGGGEADVTVTGGGQSSPQGYVLGFETANGASLTLAPGECRNDDDTYTMIKTTTITINPATNGANGLDTGSLANSTWYYTWVIAKSSDGTTAGLLSASSSSPTMPSGYDKKRRVGSVRTSGSATLYQQTTRAGQYNRRRVVWQEDVRNTFLVINGVDFSSGFTDVDMSSVCPATSRGIDLVLLVIQPSTGSNIRWDWREKGVTNQSLTIFYGFANITSNVVQQDLPLDSSQKGQIYQNFGSGNPLYAWPLGYYDDLTPTITGSSGS